MFKLIKILNSGVNVPEITKIAKPVSLNIKRGTALVISGGYASVCAATAVPTHIATEDADANSRTVYCHDVSSNMLFETTVNADPASLTVGAKVTLGKDSDNCTVCVTATETSGVATIVDLLGAMAAGDKVTVRF